MQNTGAAYFLAVRAAVTQLIAGMLELSRQLTGEYFRKRISGATSAAFKHAYWQPGDLVGFHNTLDAGQGVKGRFGHSGNM